MFGGTPLPTEAGELAREDPEIRRQRKRIRLLITGTTIGGIAAGIGITVFGALFWPSTATEPAELPIGVGLYIAAVSVWGFLWLGKLMRRAIVSVHLTTEGLRVILKNGTVLVGQWTNPKFAIDLWISSQSRRVPVTQFGMAWKMERGVAGCQLTETGWNELMASAKQLGLSVSEQHVGKEPNTWTTYRIRGPASKP